MRLTNKVAIVTGAGRGIGRAIALTLAREGANLAITDIDVNTATAAAQEISGMEREAVAIKTDVTRSDQVSEMVRAVLEKFGAIDILVNNTGWDKVEPFIKNSEETWDKIININLKGPILCTRAVLDHMIAKNSGKILNIASDAGRVGSTGEVVYSATKGGVIAFTKALAREMARYKINVNCVSPGPADTPLLQEIASYNPKLVDALQRAIPFRRIAQPQEVANAVLFLVSNEADYITGQTLSVSGGLTMV